MKHGKKKNGKTKKPSRLEFVLGLLVVVAGGSIMINMLGLSARLESYTAGVNELLLFPMAMLLLVTGVAIVAKAARKFEKK